MSVGDLSNSLEKFRRGLRAIKFPVHLLDEDAVKEGHPMQFLAVLKYALQSYSTDVADFIAEHDYDLTGPANSAYVETVYQLLRELLDYRPILSFTQFLKQGYAERKILMVLDVTKLVAELHETLVRASFPVSRATTPSPQPTILKRSPPQAKTPIKNSNGNFTSMDMFVRTMSSPNKSNFQQILDKPTRSFITDKKHSKSQSHTPQSAQIASDMSAVLSRLNELNLRVSTWMTKTDEKLEWLTSSIVKLGLS